MQKDRLTTKAIEDTLTGQLSDFTGVSVIGIAKANTDPDSLVANLQESLYAINVVEIILLTQRVGETHFSIVAVIYGGWWRPYDK